MFDIKIYQTTNGNFKGEVIADHDKLVGVGTAIREDWGDVLHGTKRSPLEYFDKTYDKVAERISKTLGHVFQEHVYTTLRNEFYEQSNTYEIEIS